MAAEAVVLLPAYEPRRLPRRAWESVWPKLAALTIALAAWQLVALSGWRPDYLLPGPGPVLARLAVEARTPLFWSAVAVTMQRAVVGYSLALLVGAVIGALVARVRLLRVAAGSLITGLQSMPSIAWFPFAMLIFGLNETAILFVVMMGAAPAIANGLITGFDHVPPLLVRAGRTLGAERLALIRHVMLPAALPSFVGGLKQGWAFAWRSLLAGELLVIIADRPSLGLQLQFARELADAEGLLATMLVILVIGMLVDTLFSALDHAIRLRWGLLDS